MERDYSYHIPDSFSGRPDRQRLSWNPGQQAAWGAIMAGIHERKGGVVILGEAGLGKTTLSRALMTSLDLQSVKTIYIADANITFPSLLQCIYNAFSLEVPSDFLSDMLSHLHSLLIEEYRAHRNVVLLLDNAHHLPTMTLTNLWLLAQLEFENASLIQMVLFGRPELAQRLNQHASPFLKCHLAVCVILSFPINAAPPPAIYQQVVRVARQTMRCIIPAVLHPLRQYVRDIPQTLPRFSTRVRTAAASMRLQLPTLLPRYLLVGMRDCRLPWRERWTLTDLAGLLARTEVALAAGRSCCQQTVQYIVQRLRSRFADLPRRWLAARQVGLSCCANSLSYISARIDVPRVGRLLSARDFLRALSGVAGLALIVSLLWHSPPTSKDMSPSDMTETVARQTPDVPAAPEATVSETRAPMQIATAAEARLRIDRFRHGVTTSTAVQRGKQVRQLQARLKAAGFAPGHVDGVLGPQTRQALRQFQKAKGLNPTGEVSAPTLKALGL